MAYSKKDSLESLADELAELENDVIQFSLETAGGVGVDSSPVLSGRFKASWDVAINADPSQTNINEIDPSGQRTKSEIERDLKSFDIREDKTVTLYNSATDPDSNFEYSETVRFDPSKEEATKILNAATLTADALLSREK